MGIDTMLEANKRQMKSKARAADHDEVFSEEQEVNAILDLVKQETLKDFRFLKLACETGGGSYQDFQMEVDDSQRTIYMPINLFAQFIKKKYMRKLYLSLLATLCIALLSYAQSDLKKENLNGYVHSVDISHYNGAIKFGESVKTDLEIKGKRYYDENGMLFMATLDDGMQSARGFVLYEYENLTERTAEKAYSRDGILQSNTEYIYDEQRRLTEKNDYTNGKLTQKEKRIYISPLVYESSIYASDGELLSVARIEMDAHMNILKKTGEIKIEAMTYGNDDKLLTETTFTKLAAGNGTVGAGEKKTFSYNQYGDIKSVAYNGKANVSTTSAYENIQTTSETEIQYKYDSNGNWISRIEIFSNNARINHRVQNDKKVAFKEREIKYAVNKEELYFFKKQVLETLEAQKKEKEQREIEVEQQRLQKIENEKRKEKFKENLVLWIEKQIGDQEIGYRLQYAVSYKIDSSDLPNVQKPMSFKDGIFKNTKTGAYWVVDKYEQHGSNWGFISKDKKYAACYYPKANKLYFVYKEYGKLPQRSIEVSSSIFYDDMRLYGFTNDEIREFSGKSETTPTIKFEGRETVNPADSMFGYGATYTIFPAESIFSAPQIKRALRKWVKEKGGEIEK